MRPGARRSRRRLGAPGGRGGTGRSGGTERIRAAGPAQLPTSASSPGTTPEGPTPRLPGSASFLRRRRRQGPRPPAPSSAAASSLGGGYQPPIRAANRHNRAGAAEAATSGHGDGAEPLGSVSGGRGRASRGRSEPRAGRRNPKAAPGSGRAADTAATGLLLTPALPCAEHAGKRAGEGEADALSAPQRRPGSRRAAGSRRLPDRAGSTAPPPVAEDARAVDLESS